MKWHELTNHGCQELRSGHEILKRAREVEEALDQLLGEIAKACSQRGTPLARAVGLRSRIPHEAGEKGFISSRYEGLNQLIHYSYCLVAARRLHAVGCKGIQIIPCARDSRMGPDVRAITRGNKTVAGEVFCVAPSLFRAKLSGVKSALEKRREDIKFVLFNRDAHQGKGYRSKLAGVAYYSFDATTSVVSTECYLEASGERGSGPLDLSGRLT